MTVLASVTGLGAVSPFGTGVAALWEATLTGGGSPRDGVLAIPETSLAAGALAVEDACRGLAISSSQLFRLTHSAALAPAKFAVTVPPVDV